MPDPRVFTIAPDAPFLPTLADSLLSGELVGPLAPDELADATIFLPTRRAGRELSQVLAARAGGRGLLLPRIVPLGDAEDDLDLDPATGAPLPPAIPPLERRLILTRLVQAWARDVDRSVLGPAPTGLFTVPASPADALSLAGELEGLMDSLATEDVDWSALAEIVEVEHSKYFALTLDFVRIAHEAWPAILAGRGAIDPAHRRNAILLHEAERLVAHPPRGPVIAAGSTGSIPATARLLAAIASLPRGALVLPGLDLDLDAAGWEAIAGAAEAGGLHGHPQYNLRRLVEEVIGIRRGDVRVLGGWPRQGTPRAALLSEVMRPAETTDGWAEMPAMHRAGLARNGAQGLTLIEGSDEREEALAVAITLRETLERPGATAALVTPDRALARRVAAELGRWGIVAQDSAGMPLADTSAGRLARLAADAAALDFHPVQVLALLAHPKVTLGIGRKAVERGAAALEIGVLRGPAPRPGLEGIGAALELRREERGSRVPRPRRALSRKDWDCAADLVARLRTVFAGFSRGHETEGVLDLVALAERHQTALEALAEPGPGATQAPDRGDDALEGLFDELALTRVDEADRLPVAGRFAEYPAFFAALARARTLASEASGTHPRLRILGLLEARLLTFDRVVLGGLDETIWPPVAQTDAFLNRPMRIGLGLTPPERRIGQTAHDFVQALGTQDAVVTRARKREGKPTVPSRFLERMRAFGGEDFWAALTGRGQLYLRLARQIDAPQPAAALSRPAPKPGPERFPRRLSVTEIETLVRDPYSIFAKHVLGLDPLDPIALQPGAADRGTLIHDVLGGFAERHPAAIPDGAEEELLQLGRDAFADLAKTYPELHALWWPAFVRLVPAYLEWERERRIAGPHVYAEKDGRIALPIAGTNESFELRGRADRIEIGPDGAAAIVDFKTGSVPSPKEVAIGFSPQLTLEAAMLTEGGFRDLPPVVGLPRLDYVKIGGRKVLDPRPVEPPRGWPSLPAIVDKHRKGLEELVRLYAVEGAGYMSRPYAKFARRYAPYDHLSRVKEWSATSGAEDPAEGTEP